MRNLNFKSPWKKVCQTWELAPSLDWLSRGGLWPSHLCSEPGSEHTPKHGMCVREGGSSPAPDAVGFYWNVLTLLNICQTFCRHEASHVSHCRTQMTERGLGPSWSAGVPLGGWWLCHVLFVLGELCLSALLSPGSLIGTDWQGHDFLVRASFCSSPSHCPDGVTRKGSWAQSLVLSRV